MNLKVLLADVIPIRRFPIEVGIDGNQKDLVYDNKKFPLVEELLIIK